MKNTLRTVRNVVGVAGLLIAGYLIVTAVPDMGRYLKISSM